MGECLLLVNGFLMRYKIALLPLFVLLVACSSKTENAPRSATVPQGGFFQTPPASQGLLSGDCTGRPGPKQLINMMVAKHGFDRQQMA